MLESAVRKRSVILNGRRTSVSLEDKFWESLRAISKAEGSTIAEFITRINDERDKVNLSSAIRTTVLEYVQQKGFDQWRAAADSDTPMSSCGELNHRA